ncbi:MAG: hypothetical protein KDC83_01995 [Flavobacteriales bacterium]|nr:hypothetical protein [Flavobacteriales bacterium]
MGDKIKCCKSYKKKHKGYCTDCPKIIVLDKPTKKKKNKYKKKKKKKVKELEVA